MTFTAKRNIIVCGFQVDIDAAPSWFVQHVLQNQPIQNITTPNTRDFILRAPNGKIYCVGADFFHTYFERERRIY